LIRLAFRRCWSEVPTQCWIIGFPHSAVQHARYMSLETIAPLSDTPAVSLPVIAA
jgi:hypothetical protein